MVNQNKNSKINLKIRELISKKEAKNNKAAKRLAMKNNVKLGKLRREFCQNCYMSLEKAKRRIKNGYVNVECGECGKKGKWKAGD